LICLSWTRG